MYLASLVGYSDNDLVRLDLMDIIPVTLCAFLDDAGGWLKENGGSHKKKFSIQLIRVGLELLEALFAVHRIGVVRELDAQSGKPHDYGTEYQWFVKALTGFTSDLMGLAMDANHAFSGLPVVGTWSDVTLYTARGSLYIIRGLISVLFGVIEGGIVEIAFGLAGGLEAGLKALHYLREGGYEFSGLPDISARWVYVFSMVAEIGQGLFAGLIDKEEYD